MKVSTKNDNNFGYENIKILVDNMPLNGDIQEIHFWYFSTCFSVIDLCLFL